MRPCAHLLMPSSSGRSPEWQIWFLTSLACALLLLRAYRQNSDRLLLWSGLCFLGLALNGMAAAG
jgi:hypothetical protein